MPNSRLYVASLLRYQCSIKGVVAPLETQKGTLSIPWQDFRVSLFPFIEGKSQWDLWKVGKNFTDIELRQTAAVLAMIHDATDPVDLECLPVAKYDLPLRNELYVVLEAAEKNDIVRK